MGFGLTGDDREDRVVAGGGQRDLGVEDRDGASAVTGGVNDQGVREEQADARIGPQRTMGQGGITRVQDDVGGTSTPSL